ncbi:MAG: hypothetical protein KKE86_01735 [Planctomycetes bacterium]|nr:hypothetical protein [Planctomycetota bacterium]MBU4398035.1 hypothetical protein [Planctomycetota bacterium]MCG2682622.1 hypothetical protein [Planctomycetales bacterium]
MKRLIAISLILAVIGLSVALGKAVLESGGVSEPSSSSSISSAKPTRTADATDDSGAGIAAIADAARAKKYLFVFFWKNEDEQTAAMKGVFEEAMRKPTDRAQSAIVCIADPTERGIVGKFDLQRAPMPLVLALAPNGAVMGGFPTKFTEEELLDAFASPCSEKCMKALQENKLVLLCVQNGSTKFNEEAMRGVRDFKGDPRFGHATEVVMLDPADTAEKPFLADLKIEPGESEAVTAFIVPPGSVIAEFKGAVDKEGFITALQKASTSCGPGGCGPNGCGPKK